MRQFKNRVSLSGAYGKFRKYINDFDFISLQVADKYVDWNSSQTIHVNQLTTTKDRQ